jgi:hypothetical protein
MVWIKHMLQMASPPPLPARPAVSSLPTGAGVLHAHVTCRHDTWLVDGDVITGLTALTCAGVLAVSCSVVAATGVSPAAVSRKLASASAERSKDTWTAVEGADAAAVAAGPCDAVVQESCCSCCCRKLLCCRTCMQKGRHSWTAARAKKGLKSLLCAKPAAQDKALCQGSCHMRHARHPCSSSNWVKG